MGSKKDKQAKEKPLEKMTATDLRAIAKELPDVTGASGMNKDELLSVIKKARGIEDTPKKNKTSMRNVKQKIRQLKDKRMEAQNAGDMRIYQILKRKISRLKKQTRRVA